MNRKEQSLGRRVALGGLLGGLALLLAALESLLPPIPVLPPGAKLGLSNVVTMFAADVLGLPWALAVVAVKAGYSFLGRGFVAGWMSLGGGLCSALLMTLLMKKTEVSWLLVGMAGALSHNGAQLLVAWVVTGTSVLFYVPVLLFFGVVTGGGTGLLLRLVLPRLRRGVMYFKQ